MSLAFPLTIIFAALCSIVVQQVVRRLVFHSKTAGCAVGIIAYPILCFLGFPWVIWLGTSYGSDLTFEQARSRINVALPSQVSDIAFYQHFHQICEVDFTIEEAEFLVWCSANGWSPKPLDSGARHPRLSTSVSTERDNPSILNGYKASVISESGDLSCIVLYDKERRRAFYRYSTF